MPINFKAQKSHLAYFRTYFGHILRCQLQICFALYLHKDW